VLAGVLLLAVLAVVLLSGDGGGDSSSGGAQPTASATPAKKKRKATPTPTAERTQTATPTSTATPSPTPTGTPASGGTGLGRAQTLQVQGFQANSSGDYTRGAQLSKQALDACGGSKQLSPCGYAAFELGKALNRLGRPDEAIPYLQQRVSYGDNSKEAEKELKDAQKKAGKG
jgi:tetratricopeptide (TPR) repeat protein